MHHFSISCHGDLKWLEYQASFRNSVSCQNWNRTQSTFTFEMSESFYILYFSFLRPWSNAVHWQWHQQKINVNAHTTGWDKHAYLTFTDFSGTLKRVMQDPCQVDMICLTKETNSIARPVTIPLTHKNHVKHWAAAVHGVARDTTCEHLGTGDRS